VPKSADRHGGLVRTWKRAANLTRACGALAAIALTGIAGCAGTSGAPREEPTAKTATADLRKQRDDRAREQAAAREQRTAEAVARCPNTAKACVDLGLRISWLQDGDQVTWGPVPILPGTPEMPGATATPTGLFRVRWKDADHVSNEYHEPMPHAVFFTTTGVAFHEGALTGGSHGCVHLSPADAKHFYEQLPRGARVAVF